VYQGQLRLATVPRQLSPRLYRKLTSAYGRRALFGYQVLPPRSVLVVRRDEIGDLAITLPLLIRLRQIWPNARVTLVAGSVPGALLRGTALVDEVVVWTRLQGGRRPSIGPLAAFRFARRLIRGRRRFDLALLPHRDSELRGARRVAAVAARQIIGLDPRVWSLGPGWAAGTPETPRCPGPRRLGHRTASRAGVEPSDKHRHGRQPTGPPVRVGLGWGHRRASTRPSRLHHH
jgi:hypothetical protein